MKRLSAMLIMGLLVMATPGVASSVTPQSVTFTNIRDEAQAYCSETYYYQGTTLVLTNCVMYSGTSTNSARQGLTAVTIEVRVGATTTNVPYTGTAIVATNGTWWCNITVPTFVSTPYLQVKVTDASTNTYIYPWKIIHTLEALD